MAEPPDGFQLPHHLWLKIPESTRNEITAWTTRPKPRVPGRAATSSFTPVNIPPTPSDGEQTGLEAENALLKARLAELEQRLENLVPAPAPQPPDDDARLRAQIEAQVRAEKDKEIADKDEELAKLRAAINDTRSSPETVSPVSPPPVSTQHAEIAALRAAKEAAEERAKAAEARAAQAEKHRTARSNASAETAAQRTLQRPEPAPTAPPAPPRPELLISIPAGTTRQGALPDASYVNSDVGMADAVSTTDTQTYVTPGSSPPQAETGTGQNSPDMASSAVPAGTQYRDPPLFVQQADSPNSDSTIQSPVTSPCTSEEDPMGQAKAAAPEPLSQPIGAITQASEKRHPLPNGRQHNTSSLPSPTDMAPTNQTSRHMLPNNGALNEDRRRSARLRPVTNPPGPDGSGPEGPSSIEAAASPETSLHANDMDKLDEFLEKLDPDCSLVKIEGLQLPNIENTQISKLLGHRKHAAVLAVHYASADGENVVYLEAQDYEKFKQPVKIPDFDAANTQRPTVKQAQEFLNDLWRRSSTGAEAGLRPYFVGPLSDGVPGEFKLLNPGRVLDKWRLKRRKEPNKHISGVTTPWLHWGGPKTGTAWHREDAGLWSVNLNLGGWKLWILITDDGTEFEKQVRELLRIPQDQRLCDQWLRHLALFISPEQLDGWGIAYKVIVQGTGEMVVTRSRQYHCVVNLTTSLAVAINILPLGEPAFPKAEVLVCSECGLELLVGEEGCNNFRSVDENVEEAEGSEGGVGERSPRTTRAPKGANPTQQPSAPARQMALRSAAKPPSGTIAPHPDSAGNPSPNAKKRNADPTTRKELAPPPKKLKSDLPAIAKHLLGSDAVEQFKTIFLAWCNQEPYPSTTVELGNSATLLEQAIAHYNLACNWDDSSIFSQFMFMIHDCQFVERIDQHAKAEGYQRLPKHMILQVRDQLKARHPGATEEGLKSRLRRTRRWQSIGQGFLPFIPLGQGQCSGISLRTLGDLTNDELERLHGMLKNSRGTMLNQAGQALHAVILGRKELSTDIDSLRILDAEDLLRRFVDESNGYVA